MYSLINLHTKNNPNWIAETFRKDNHFQKYINVKIDKLHNKDFKSDYKLFWVMYPARLNESFINTYFSLLEESNLDLENALKRIKELDKGFQFSFITKLLHTQNTNLPIYDRMVSQFYFLPDIWSIEGWEEKTKLALEIHDFLQKEYKRIKDEDLLNYSISELNIFLEQIGIHKNSISYTKKIDSLIWAWVSFLNKKSFLNYKVQWE